MVLVGGDVFFDWRGEPDVVGPARSSVLRRRPGADDAVCAEQVIACWVAAESGQEFIKTEHLYTFDGKRGFLLGQAE